MQAHCGRGLYQADTFGDLIGSGCNAYVRATREALRLDNTDNDDIITGLLAAIPDYIELCTGIPAEAQKTEPLADTAGKFILTLWYHAERVDADKIQRTIDSLLKTLQLKAERG